MTPLLYVAVCKGHGEVVVKALLKGGCDVDKAGNRCTTPMLMAAHGREERERWEGKGGERKGERGTQRGS